MKSTPAGAIAGRMSSPAIAAPPRLACSNHRYDEPTPPAFWRSTREMMRYEYPKKGQKLLGDQCRTRARPGHGSTTARLSQLHGHQARSRGRRAEVTP